MRRRHAAGVLRRRHHAAGVLPQAGFGGGGVHVAEGDRCAFGGRCSVEGQGGPKQIPRQHGPYLATRSAHHMALPTICAYVLCPPYVPTCSAHHMCLCALPTTCPCALPTCSARHVPPPSAQALCPTHAHALSPRALPTTCPALTTQPSTAVQHRYPKSEKHSKWKCRTSDMQPRGAAAAVHLRACISSGGGVGVPVSSPRLPQGKSPQSASGARAHTHTHTHTHMHTQAQAHTTTTHSHTHAAAGGGAPRGSRAGGAHLVLRLDGQWR